MEEVLAHEFALAIAEAAMAHDIARQQFLLREQSRAEAGEYPHIIPLKFDEEHLFLA